MEGVEHAAARDPRATQLSQAQIVFGRALADARQEGYLLAVAEAERHIGGGIKELHDWIKSHLEAQ